MHTKATASQKVNGHADTEALPAFGVWAPSLTPLKENLGVDTDRYVTHVKWLLGQGCHGIVVWGSTGEANSFSVNERCALLEALLDAGIPAHQLMVGTGCCALTDSVTLTAHAVAHGCEKVLVLPPFYYKGVSDDGIYRHYAEIVERVGEAKLRIFFYHFPKLSAVPITLSLVERLLDTYPTHMAGLKDSAGDWTNTFELLKRFPSLAIFPGSETFLLDGLQRGGAGCITASANINARAIRNVYDGYRAQAPDVKDEQNNITSVRRVLDEKPLVPTLKGIVSRMRKDPEWLRMRPPFVARAPALSDAGLAALTDAGFVLPGAHTP